eukprot:NODE_47_length_32105_cov_1.240892.p2 type:complete len:722 gc:universal NODE_47_length_32105_cov_1.240892:9254-7089(-)
MTVGNQLKVMLKKNTRLQMKSWRTMLCLMILTPVISLSICYWILSAASDASLVSNLDPTVSPVAPVMACIPGNSPCISIAYSPITPLNSLIMDTVSQLNVLHGGQAFKLESTDVTELSKNMDIVGFSTDSKMHDFIFKNQNTTALGVKFTHQLDRHIYNYEIWQNKTNMGTSGDSASGQAVSFQVLLEEAFLNFNDLKVDTNNPPSSIKPVLKMKYSTQPLPKIPLNSDTMDLQYPVRSLLPLFLLISSIPIFINIITTITNEESKGLISGLVAFGVWPSIFYISQLISQLPIILINSLVVMIMGIIYNFEIFQGDPSILFVGYFMYLMSFTALGMTIASCIRRPGLALFTAIFIMVICCALQIVEGILMSVSTGDSPIYYFWYSPDVMSPSVHQALELIPIFNLNKIIKDVFTLNQHFRNSTTGDLVSPTKYVWADADKSTFIKQYNSTYPGVITNLMDHTGSTGDSFGILVGIFLFYFILALYFDKIVTNTNGKVEKPWFFLDPEYYKQFGTQSIISDIKEWIGKYLEDEPSSQDTGVLKQRQQAITNLEHHELRLVNLKKEYGGLFTAKKMAVKGLSFVFKENQLLAFLGQNGGGKTTTLKILSGFLKQSAGDALVHQKSVKSSISDIQAFSGITPQFDLLYGELNALEHLNMYCDLKNVPAAEKSKLIEERLNAVLLWDVRHLPSKSYSGGMKRRLSVVISTIGDPKFLILDEPTVI